MSCVWVPGAHAYIDPGSGSLILQAALGALAAGLFVMKAYWQKVKTFFSREPASPAADPDRADDR